MASQESISSISTLDEKPYFCVELNHPYESAECDRGWNEDGIYSAFTWDSSNITDRVGKKDVIPYIIQQLTWISHPSLSTIYILINYFEIIKLSELIYSYNIFICREIRITCPEYILTKLRNTSIRQRLRLSHSGTIISLILSTVFPSSIATTSIMINASYVNIDRCIDDTQADKIILWNYTFWRYNKIFTRLLHYRAVFSFYYVRERNVNKWQNSLFTYCTIVIHNI